MARILLIPGDGIGPEITEQAVKVIQTTGKLSNKNFEMIEMQAGGAAIDQFSCPLPQDTLEAAKNSDAVFLGAVGGPKWDALTGDMRPERALLGLRKGLGLFGNLRPVLLPPALSSDSPLRQELVEGGLDLLIVRELTGGIYFGDHGEKVTEAGKTVWNTESYSTSEIERVARLSFKLAEARRGKLTSVDKANVLSSSRLWRDTVNQVAKEYPHIELEHMYVDNCAMQLIRWPKQFDVVLTSNIFGDILSDEASVLAGSIGMLPSASLRQDNFGMYEPAHGSAPDIAGQNKANPLATILSVSMMCKFSLGLSEQAELIEKAVQKVLSDGFRTPDMYKPGLTKVTTTEMGDLVTNQMLALKE